MAAHFSVESSSHRSTRDSARLIFRGAGAVALTLTIIAGLEVSFASGRSDVEFSGDASKYVVNRIQKGDRLLEAPALRLIVLKKTGDVTRPRLPLKLLEGCDALVSVFADRRLARVAARCLS
jgi:hypothetical protein